jgi:hypothetical protein
VLHAGKVTKRAAKQGVAREPMVRWYDARARVALRRVATWLNVPHAKLGTFECLLAQQSQVSTFHALNACLAPSLGNYGPTHEFPLPAALIGACSRHLHALWLGFLQDC